MNKEKSMNTTTINDTAQDVGDATELTEGFGGDWTLEPTTDDYYQPA
ncbi:hypothetical protein HAP41_0000048225 (plasmid) [Bradyrhizobium barranii subsp. apii]|uniref:Uncharacterized protein n=1 Tax=Bradyrhizobium barranii subsp. apii TaxID=2819348 RepID=A0A8T5VVH7_9BRAD|nr:hypothetical protein [Bradyrhizobium barranii]UPT92096.1 hypothetical protein HAP41_0000048225 [Bradyrhizobium barranii subsp. apii]